MSLTAKDIQRICAVSAELRAILNELASHDERAMRVLKRFWNKGRLRKDAMLQAVSNLFDRDGRCPMDDAVFEVLEAVARADRG